MVDREKVIKGLGCCAHEEIGDCENCPYNENTPHCDIAMMRDAIALLKAQEPKLLTIEDFTPEKLRDIHHVWVEIRPGYYNADLDRYYGGKPYPAVVTRWSGTRCDSIGNVCQVWIPGGYESLFNVNNDYNTGYGVKWRCWTSRPSDAQREATPWQ